MDRYRKPRLVARRHSGCAVTTASIDRLDFLESASLNDLIVLKGGCVLFVGRTSMLVEVDTFVETGNCRERKLVQPRDAYHGCARRG